MDTIITTLLSGAYVPEPIQYAGRSWGFDVAGYGAVTNAMIIVLLIGACIGFVILWWQRRGTMLNAATLIGASGLVVLTLSRIADWFLNVRTVLVEPVFYNFGDIIVESTQALGMLLLIAGLMYILRSSYVLTDPEHSAQ